MTHGFRTQQAHVLALLSLACVCLVSVVEAQIRDAHAAQEGTASHFVTASDECAGRIEAHDGTPSRNALVIRNVPVL